MVFSTALSPNFSMFAWYHFVWSSPFQHNFTISLSFYVLMLMVVCWIFFFGGCGASPPNTTSNLSPNSTPNLSMLILVYFFVHHNLNHLVSERVLPCSSLIQHTSYLSLQERIVEVSFLVSLILENLLLAGVYHKSSFGMLMVPVSPRDALQLIIFWRVHRNNFQEILMRCLNLRSDEKSRALEALKDN